MAKSTSLRFTEDAKHQLDHPGIVFRGPAHDRRAGVAAGPDVWEIVSRLQGLEGSEEQRVTALSAESDRHPVSSATRWTTPPGR